MSTEMPNNELQQDKLCCVADNNKNNKQDMDDKVVDQVAMLLQTSCHMGPDTPTNAHQTLKPSHASSSSVTHDKRKSQPPAKNPKRRKSNHDKTRWDHQQGNKRRRVNRRGDKIEILTRSVKDQDAARQHHNSKPLSVSRDKTRKQPPPTATIRHQSSPRQDDSESSSRAHQNNSTTIADATPANQDKSICINRVSCKEDAQDPQDPRPVTYANVLVKNVIRNTPLPPVQQKDASAATFHQTYASPFSVLDNETFSIQHELQKLPMHEAKSMKERLDTLLEYAKLKGYSRDEIRDDSRLAWSWALGTLAPTWTIDAVVNEMCYFCFLHDHTQYNATAQQLVHNTALSLYRDLKPSPRLSTLQHHHESCEINPNDPKWIYCKKQAIRRVLPVLKDMYRPLYQEYLSNMKK